MKYYGIFSNPNNERENLFIPALFSKKELAEQEMKRLEDIMEEGDSFNLSVKELPIIN